nr:MAG TPA: hypothetical protein [Caudoviricetes sp.]
MIDLCLSKNHCLWLLQYDCQHNRCAIQIQ